MLPAGCKVQTNRVLDEVWEERIKQIQKWGNASDDAQVNGEIAQGAGAYALDCPQIFPNDGVVWHRNGFKTESDVGRRGQLIRAAAMIVAEIERLDRRNK